MKNINWSGAMRSLAIVAAAACAVPAAMASDRLEGLFSKIEPSLRERAFMRLNYIHANVKTTSGDAYDVTGPVVGINDIYQYLGTGSGYTSMFGVPQATYNLFSAALTGKFNSTITVPNGAIERDSVYCAQLAVGLGTPCGIKAKSDSTVGTPAISVGYFLDESMNWAIEAFLLAAPIKAEVYGDGRNALNGKKIIETNLLPPTVVVGRYFGASTSRIRPFVGIGGSYAMFMNTKATSLLNTYQGGGSEGDTTVSIKNAMGFGPFFGLMGNIDDDWHVSVNIGKLRYNTEATLVTRNTRIATGSQVVADYGTAVGFASTVTVEATLGGTATVVTTGTPEGYVAGQKPGGLTALMCDLAKAKYGSNSCNHGTFVRKQQTKLDSTLFMLSVGRRF